MDDLQMNLGSYLYFEGQSQLLNWAKVCNPMVIHRTAGGDIQGKAAWDAGVYLDPATGELKNPVPADVTGTSRAFYAPFQNNIAGASFAGETWFHECTGAAGVTFSGTSASALVSGNKYSFTTDGSTAWVHHAITDHNNPPRNVKIYQARYAANVAAGENWSPDWKAAAGQWDVGRWLNPQSQNNSWQTDFNQLSDFGDGTVGQYFGIYYSGPFTGPLTNCDYGPKGSIHPNIICDFANFSGKKQHVTIPLHFTDAAVTAFATFMRDHTTITIMYELSNECWNSGFYQLGECATLGAATGLWPGDPSWVQAWKYYGYRSAQVMKLIRDVYGAARSRWEGVLGSQAGNVGVLDTNIIGAKTYLTTAGLVMTSVYDNFQGATYIGDVIISSVPQVLGQGANTTLYFNSPYDLYYQLDPINGSPTIGNTYRVHATFDPGSPYAGLTGTYNATYATTTSIVMSGMNSVGLAAFVSGSKNYINNGLIYDLAAQSVALHGSNPTRYPTNSQYFKEQLRDAMMTGTSSSGLVMYNSFNYFYTTQWAAFAAYCTANGVVQKMYEGGNTVSGDVYVSGFGGNPILTPLLIEYATSTECSEAVGAMFQGFYATTGQAASKFNFEGDNSQYGPWGTYQFPPLVGNGGVGDVNNAVYKRCQVANNGNRQIKVVL